MKCMNIGKGKAVREVFCLLKLSLYKNSLIINMWFVLNCVSLASFIILFLCGK